MSLVGYSAWGCKELDMTEWLSTHNVIVKSYIYKYIYCTNSLQTILTCSTKERKNRQNDQLDTGWKWNMWFPCYQGTIFILCKTVSGRSQLYWLQISSVWLLEISKRPIEECGALYLSLSPPYSFKYIHTSMFKTFMQTECIKDVWCVHTMCVCAIFILINFFGNKKMFSVKFPNFEWLNKTLGSTSIWSKVKGLYPHNLSLTGILCSD